MRLRRLRLLTASSGLVFLLGGALVGASANTPAGISAHLTSKNFTAAQARTVKLVYKFSSKSSRFAYALSRKAGSSWSKVLSVSKRGSFRGSHTMTVSGLFGSKRIVVGQYRLTLSGSANSITVSFTIKMPAPPATVKPEAGRWVATSLTGPVSGDGTGIDVGFHVTATSLFFTVAPEGVTVTGFGFPTTCRGPEPRPGVVARNAAPPLTKRHRRSPRAGSLPLTRTRGATRLATARSVARSTPRRERTALRG